jgi:ADP-ribose pyrophosphatase YjhB (NUDIX family)
LVDDLALQKGRSERDKSRFLVKRNGVILRVKDDARTAVSARVGNQRVEHGTTEPAAAIRREHRHTADVRGARARTIGAAGCDGRAGDADERVTRVDIRAVVFVDFFIRRHVLLVDKHAQAHGERLRQPFAIVNIKQFDVHEPSRAILRATSNSGEVFRRIHLCVGLLERDGAILLVGNAYPNRSTLLWNLPGGRQDGHETCAMTVVREFREETALHVRIGALAYVAESFDLATATHFTATCFAVAADGDPRIPANDAHVRAYRWVQRTDLAAVLDVRVVREPLLGYLADPAQQYYGFMDAGITIAFADEPAAPRGATEPA